MTESPGQDVVEPKKAEQPAAAPPPAGLFGRVQEILLDHFSDMDAVLYPLFAWFCAIYAASTFYGYMHFQTQGIWSAPLDDVFIHFDYARATARGFPFQWYDGNGFSSGNTSLLYPFVLAIGYVIGFQKLQIMEWAAFVAVLSMTFFLFVCGRLMDALNRSAKYIAPMAVFSLGALNWSLWSGMENAFHLGVWALLAWPVLALVRESRELREVRRYGWLAGAASVLLYATRPESVICIAVFSIYAALAVRRSLGWRDGIATLLRIGVPGALAAVAQAITNRVFTGEWSAAGAIVKLAINHPYMTSSQKLDEWLFNVKYVILRNTQHHFAEILGHTIPWGWLVPLVALLPFASKKLRGIAAVLWIQVIGWLLIVSLNGQVRWQNERYTMSAVAWLFVLAAMGLSVLLAPSASPSVSKARFSLGLRAALACAVVVIYWKNQAPNMRDQIWFFGRASRNILDQHILTGKVLAQRNPKRILVGDAGALIYAADAPGLDIIGLGGYHDYPFARAGVYGLGATLELIERMPLAERPDYMAIYPSWWGDLPGLFGRRLVGIPVVGNVICGGAEKVIYKADWSALDQAGTPRSIRDDERIKDELDVADLISEKKHGYDFPHPAMGYVVHRVLPEPGSRSHDLFDAGRIIPYQQSETALVTAPKGQGRLVIRTVTGKAVSAEIRADERLLGKLKAPATTTWTEPSLVLPADLPPRFTLRITPVDGEWVSYHVWILESDAP